MEKKYRMYPDPKTGILRPVEGEGRKAMIRAMLGDFVYIFREQNLYKNMYKITKREIRNLKERYRMHKLYQSLPEEPIIQEDEF